MKTSSLWVDIVLILLVAAPIVYLILMTTGKEKKAKKEVTKICKKNGLTVSNFDITGNLILGMDEGHKKLIMSHRKNIERDFKVIDLQSLKECRVKTIKLSKNTTDWVGLELLKPDSKLDISFYDESNDDGPYIDPLACIKKAEQWEKLIKPLLKAS
ncbi:hypothetical protein [Ulvibacter antarcticus]|uniref:Uncharacterized protein n=1 Tax=Ulvibacter antarcticus TaxID=442714 RepID=A0A3L9Z1N0_9FLAO|nr:hypothetical protein [Ulvibacter antarcticus]RMA65917.1 hypothetical protein BXY75_0333 [Ulvibacter antarcticus]